MADNSTQQTTTPFVATEDREAAIAFLSRLESMDVALLGLIVCCAFHAWVRRLGAEDWRGVSQRMGTIRSAMR